MIDSKFIVELKRFRRREIDIFSFRKWMIDNYKNLQPVTPSGLLIKLKRGTELQAMTAIASILSSCQNCRDFCQKGIFLTRTEYAACASKVLEATKTGVLKQVARPAWFYSDDKHFGADAYYTCEICDSLWTLVTPEREDNGLWARIA
jgi:hypothetical protein